MLNKIILQGRLTRDPELRQLPDGSSVLNFSMAVDRDYLNRESGERETDFVDCVAFRGTAEFMDKYFKKGSMLLVSGRLRVRNWKDKDGYKRRSTEVIAENVYFGESKRKEERAGEDWTAAADALEQLGDELADVP